jgi:DNA polymerase-3 subunit epsilon/ATP-dependent DNA helicase DinG
MVVTMLREWVAFDLETTGLDARVEAITEIAAVRYQGDRELATFHTLVNPRRNVPEQVTIITGITNEMVARAPTIDSVLPQFLDFVGTSPVVAHSADFDVSFVRAVQPDALRANLVIDTFELAGVMLPTIARYSLGNLTAELGLVLDDAHRALSDARAHGQLYWTLWQKILALPRPLVRAIAEAGERVKWPLTEVFSTASELAANRPLSESHFPAVNGSEPVKAGAPPQPVLIDRAAAMIAPGGQLAEKIPDFTTRPQQQTMLREVATALNKAENLMIEAGTGVGKTLAYLLPASIWATQNARPVIISTYTLNLQDQLLKKDLPLVREALGIDVQAAVLKGRSNYLCLRLWDELKRRGPRDRTEAHIFAKLSVWLEDGGSGDRAELSFRNSREDDAWRRLSAEEERCGETRCLAAGGRCPLHRARSAAAAAHLLIVNHALLIEDVKSDNAFLPDAREVIIDEAHHLEDAVTHSLTRAFEQAMLEARLNALGTASAGLLGDILLKARRLLDETEIMRLEGFIIALGEAAQSMMSPLRVFFGQLADLQKELTPANPFDVAFGIRILPAHRRKDTFSQLASAWSDLKEYLDVMIQQCGQLLRKLRQLSEQEPEFESVQSALRGTITHLADDTVSLDAFVSGSDQNLVFWLNGGASNTIAINSAPVHVGFLLQERLWDARRSVILTSATLRSGEDSSMDFLRARLGLQNAREAVLGSPFDYQRAVMLYLPSDMPGPEEKIRYQSALERAIIEMAVALDGRLLVLFTSYAHLRQTTNAVAPRLALGKINVYSQSDGGSRQLVVDQFASANKAVLLGTRGLWEGVDIPGPALSGLIIAKLPFTPPNSPIVAARAENYSNAFSQLQLPEAILLFRQGFGRLIRSDADRGVVAVLDSRITTKGYGTQFVGALPDCTVFREPLSSMAARARQWLPELSSDDPPND